MFGFRICALSVALIAPAAFGADEDATANANAGPIGLVSIQSVRNVAETIGQVETSLLSNDAVSVVARVDHQANARTAGLGLRPTEVILFGNPALGAPLIQQSQTAGLDLPQKILAWQDARGKARLAYNTAAYLADRHGIEDADQTLTRIDAALEALAENAAGATIKAQDQPEAVVGEGDGIVTVESKRSVNATFAALKQAVEAAAPLSIIAEVDHAANVAAINLKLRPTKLLIFGNPALGTRLLRSAQMIGIDLPQKMLVYKNRDGRVSIAYNDPFYLAARHGIEDRDAVLQQISLGLKDLATSAANMK